MLDTNEKRQNTALTAIEVEQICSLYASGMTAGTIAKQYKRRSASIHKIARSRGVVYGYGERVKESRVPDTRVCELYRSGWTALRIAKKYGRSVNTIYKIIRAGGLGKTKQINTHKARLEEYYIRFMNGESIKEISNKSDVDPSSLRRWLLTANYDLEAKQGKHNHTIKLDFDSIYNTYKNGASLRVIADLNGVSYPYLSQQFKLRGYALRRGGSRKRLVELDIPAIHNEYSRGITLFTLGSLHNVSGQYLSRQFKLRGLPVRTGGNQPGIKLGKYGNRVYIEPIPYQQDIVVSINSIDTIDTIKKTEEPTSRMGIVSDLLFTSAYKH